MNAMPHRPRAKIEAAPGMAPLPPLPALETIEQVHAALAELDMQRIEAQRTVDGEDAADAALIAAGADESEFAKLAMRVRAAKRNLARLEVRERDILIRAQEIEDARRQALWTDFRADFIDAAGQLARAAREAEQLRARVFGIITAAHRAGFGQPGAPPFPAVYGDVPWHFLTLPAFYAQNIPPHPPAAPSLSLGPTLLIELLKPHGGMSMAALHRVPAERAKWLVEQGIAAIVPENPWGERPDPDVIAGKREAT